MEARHNLSAARPPHTKAPAEKLNLALWLQRLVAASTEVLRTPLLRMTLPVADSSHNSPPRQHEHIADIGMHGSSDSRSRPLEEEWTTEAHSAAAQKTQ